MLISVKAVDTLVNNRLLVVLSTVTVVPLSDPVGVKLTDVGGLQRVSVVVNVKESDHSLPIQPYQFTLQLKV